MQWGAVRGWGGKQTFVGKVLLGVLLLNLLEELVHRLLSEETRKRLGAVKSPVPEVFEGVLLGGGPLVINSFQNFRLGSGSR